MKNAIRKFPEEWDEYIRRTDPQGYAATEPVPALQPLAH
jgi:hypothetical protein